MCGCIKWDGGVQMARRQCIGPRRLLQDRPGRHRRQSRRRCSKSTSWPDPSNRGTSPSNYKSFNLSEGILLGSVIQVRTECGL